MSKGAIGIEPYWPQGIPRYLASPSIPVEDAFLRRPASRGAGNLALAGPGAAATYGELARRVEARAAVLASFLESNQRVALAMSSLAEELMWTLAALWARLDVYLIDAASPPDLAVKALERFEPARILVDHGALSAALYPWREIVLTVDELRPGGDAQRRPGEGHLFSAGGDGVLFRFSGRALLAMAISWSTYVDFRSGAVLQLESLASWEGLCCALAALFRGAAVFQARWGTGQGIEVPAGVRYTIVRWEHAEALARELPRGLVGCVYLSLSTPVSLREYRQLANLIYPTPLVLAFGLPETGPVLAHHPTWFLEESIGLPITNVDVWPLNPRTGTPLDVSWEALEYAELGVKSPSIAAGSLPPEAWPARLQGQWLRSHRLVQTDANGFFYLLAHRPRAS